MKNLTEHQRKWAQSIFDEFNSIDFKKPDSRGDGTWTFEEFDSLNDLIKFIALDAGIHSYLIEHKLINNGICPITGDITNSTKGWTIFGRTVVMSYEGIEIAKESDPDYIQKNKNYDTYLRQQEKQMFRGWVKVFIVFIVIMLVVKACS